MGLNKSYLTSSSFLQDALLDLKQANQDYLQQHEEHYQDALREIIKAFIDREVARQEDNAELMEMHEHNIKVLAAKAEDHIDEAQQLMSRASLIEQLEGDPSALVTAINSFSFDR